ncbi:MAG TPA: choice-of-anchor J domain-containing protein [Flavobacterium sp.]|nr:choice-of-anchor J domain-containing protein [Flavobacterium sp.]
MKKIYFLLSLLFAAPAFAQLSENFDAESTLPGFWTSFRGTNGLGELFDWGIGQGRTYSAPNCAFVRYEANTGGINEDWLVTSAVDLTNYTGTALTFYAGQQYTDPYATVYKVKVSTTSQDDISTFTDLGTYSEADFAGAGAAPLTAQFTIDLNAYNGQSSVYIAFVMLQNDGDNWFLDDVNVTGTLSTKVFDKNTMVSVFPNPSGNIVNLNTNMEIRTVEVYGVLGNLVQSVSNSKTVDISGLANGTYQFKITNSEGSVFNHKVVKK